jgi:outer membrane immunogenic protein
MRRIVFAAVAAVLLALGSQTVSAADMPVKAPVYKAPPVVSAYNWTGWYIGLNVGGSREALSNSLSVANALPSPAFSLGQMAGIAAAGSGSLNTSGLTGGGQIGYNSQFGNLVWGAELDFNWLDLKSNFGGAFVTTDRIPIAYNLNVSQSVNWMFAVRPRLGIAVDRALFYTTGGLAVAKLKFDQSWSSAAWAPPTIIGESVSASQIKAGWVLGAGIEQALMDRWTVKGRVSVFSVQHGHIRWTTC